MNTIEKILFKKIELWTVALLGFAALVLFLLFGSAVRHYFLGGQKLGQLGPLVGSVASFPSVIKKVIFSSPLNQDLLANEQRFEGQTGFLFGYAVGTRPDFGYVLLNRYDADVSHSVSELWDLNTQEKIHTWSYSGVDEVWRRSKLSSVFTNLQVDAAPARFRAGHALLTPEGELDVSWETPLIRTDLCSRSSLLSDGAVYHHSTERDEKGNLWMPSHLEPKQVTLGGPKFMDDAVVMLSPSGEVLFLKSVVQMLEDNGLGYLVYGKGDLIDDPIHLNDIQPVLTDGRYWKKGDIFLSLRHQSMVLLYRPSSNKIVWHKQGPWLHQHDVNIVSDHEISVFNNNAQLTVRGNAIVRGSNQLLIYDFDSDTVRSPWQAGFEKLNIRTITEGRGKAVGREAFVEETNYGRLLQFDAKGKVSWQYVNRARDGKVYMLNWSRLVTRELGDKIRLLVAEKKCS